MAMDMVGRRHGGPILAALSYYGPDYVRDRNRAPEHTLGNLTSGQVLKLVRSYAVSKTTMKNHCCLEPKIMREQDWSF